MPIRPCPACHRATTRILDAPTEHAAVNYYRCEACGHVWTTDKGTGAIIHHVTPLTRVANRQEA